MKVDKITPQIAGMLIGQKAELFWDGQLDRTGTFIEIQPENEIRNGLGFETDMGTLYYPYSDVVFLLRRLESITEEEAREVYKAAHGVDFQGTSALIWWNNPKRNDYKNREIEIGTPAALICLLSKGFDLFGLIDAGLAKEITKN